MTRKLASLEASENSQSSCSIGVPAEEMAVPVTMVVSCDVVKIRLVAFSLRTPSPTERTSAKTLSKADEVHILCLASDVPVVW